ncbi:hypothetical protein SE1_02004, partial [Enterococcus hirae EnGen0127]
GLQVKVTVTEVLPFNDGSLTAKRVSDSEGL